MKDWYSDWKLSYKTDGKSFTDILVSLPHCSGNAHNIRIRKTSDARIMWLLQILDGALTQLSQSPTDKKSALPNQDQDS